MHTNNHHHITIYSIKFYVDNLQFLSFPQILWCPFTVCPPPSCPRQLLILFPPLQFTVAYSRPSCKSQWHNMYSFVSVSFDWLECVRLIQAVVYHKHLFLFYCWVISYCINVPQFVYPLFHGWMFGAVSSFEILWIKLLWTFTSEWTYIFLSLGCTPGSGIAGS